MVERIEEYKQMNGVSILKVYCKPTANFPEGYNYFYTPAEAEHIVRSYSWNIVSRTDISKRYVQRSAKICGKQHTYNFTRDLFIMYHKDCSYDTLVYQIDHVNQCAFDNTDKNMNLVDFKANQNNRFFRGYRVNKPNLKYGHISYDFQPCVTVQGKLIRPSTTHNEFECCEIQYNLELENYSYLFDFKKYRRGSEDILDLERTGIISEEEATYKHILKYADNAWYYYRYNLRDYFKDNNIPVPKYSLDAQGFMVHPITGQKLCPF